MVTANGNADKTGKTVRRKLGGQKRTGETERWGDRRMGRQNREDRKKGGIALSAAVIPLSLVSLFFCPGAFCLQVLSSSILLSPAFLFAPAAFDQCFLRRRGRCCLGSRFRFILRSQPLAEIAQDRQHGPHQGEADEHSDGDEPAELKQGLGSRPHR